MKLCVFLVIPYITSATSRSSTSSQWIHNHLKRLNKPPLKSIKSPDGDIIDCVDIYNQPALDHPSLRNHTIQMRPSVYPEGAVGEAESEKGSKPFTQLWQLNGRCPQGTVPIRRISKEDILRVAAASSIERFGIKKPNTIPRTNPSYFGANPNASHEYAIAFVAGKGQKYCGAKAVINAWKPVTQEPGELSSAQIWLLGGPFETGKLNSIEAGWQVWLFGDSNTHLFIYGLAMDINPMVATI